MPSVHPHWLLLVGLDVSDRRKVLHRVFVLKTDIILVS